MTRHASAANASMSGVERFADLQVDDLMLASQELTDLNRRLTAAQERLLQSERLASIGQLAAGVAHEINNPVGFVCSNVATLEKYLADLLTVLAAYEECEPALAGTAASRRLCELRQAMDLDYLKQDIPALMRETQEGLARVRKIVQDLKDFSHVDARREWEWFDLHQGIDLTLNIVSNEIKYKADVVKQYGNLPEVHCLASELNQVFLNLLVNAVQSIDKDRGTITVRTGVTGEQVWIDVEDDGSGIAPNLLPRIFDPFFTTKPIGKGTGLGLSLSYGIVHRHGGRIDVDSRLGRGTRFRVWIPIRQAMSESDCAAQSLRLHHGEVAP